MTEIRERNASFGTSLLLANIGPNSPMTPKIINGSYAALFDNSEVITDFSKKIDDLKKDIDSPSKLFTITSDSSWSCMACILFVNSDPVLD